MQLQIVHIWEGKEEFLEPHTFIEVSGTKQFILTTEQSLVEPPSYIDNFRKYKITKKKKRFKTSN